MTLDELNRRMAELDGWMMQECKPGYGRPYFGPGMGGWGDEEEPLPSYTTSLDAIRPVLEKMTDEELWLVAKQISRCNSVSLLRVTPKQLCRAVVATKGQQ